MEMDKVLIIVVSYNAMPWAKKCFDSILHLNQPVDCIVIDNGSSDGTIEFISKEYPSIHLFVSNTNLGFGRGNNVGLKKAIKEGYDYVYLLNQDAWLEEDSVQKLINASKAHPEYGILSPLQVDASGFCLDKNFSLMASEKHCPGFLSDALFNSLQDVYSVDKIMAAHWFMPCRVLRQLGGFLPLFTHCGEDGNLIDRAIFHGYKVGIVPSVKSIHDRKSRKKDFFSTLYYPYVNIIEIMTDIRKSTAFRLVLLACLLPVQLLIIIYCILFVDSSRKFVLLRRVCINLPFMFCESEKTKRQYPHYIE